MASQKVDNALVDLLTDQVEQTTFGGCILITLVGVFIWSAFPVEHVFGWMLAGYLFAVPRYLIIRRMENNLSPDESRNRLEWVIGIILFISALHWGGLQAGCFLKPIMFRIFLWFVERFWVLLHHRWQSFQPDH